MLPCNSKSLCSIFIKYNQSTWYNVELIPNPRCDRLWKKWNDNVVNVDNLNICIQICDVLMFKCWLMTVIINSKSKILTIPLYCQQFHWICIKILPASYFATYFKSYCNFWFWYWLICFLNKLIQQFLRECSTFNMPLVYFNSFTCSVLNFMVYYKRLSV